MQPFTYELPDHYHPVSSATAFTDWYTAVSSASEAAIDWRTLLAHYLGNSSFAELTENTRDMTVAQLGDNAPKDEVLKCVRSFRDFLVLQAGLHGEFANFIAWNFYPERLCAPFMLRMAPNRNLFINVPDRAEYLRTVAPQLDAALEGRFAGIEPGSPRYNGRFIHEEFTLFLHHQGWEWCRVNEDTKPVSGELYHPYSLTEHPEDVAVLFIDAEVSLDPRDAFSVAILEKARQYAEANLYNDFMVIGNTAMQMSPSSGRNLTVVGAGMLGEANVPVVLPQKKVPFDDYNTTLSFHQAVGVPVFYDDQGGLMARTVGIPVGIQIPPAKRTHLTGAAVFGTVGEQ